MTASPYDLLAFPSDADLTDDKLLRQLFMDAFPHMIKSFCDFLAADYGLDNPEYVNRVQRLLEYTCIGGKYNRGMLIVSGTKDLCVVKGLDIQEKLGASIILGWCVEIVNILNYSDECSSNLCN